MRKNTKTVLKGFDYLHCDDFADYLEEMARKGWHFKEWGAGLVFERGAPENSCYAVEVFINGSEFDTRPDVHTQEFAEYCEAAGWKLIDAKRKFCIFKKVREDAEEILTDEERLHNISKEEQKEIGWQMFLTIWFSVLQIFQFTGSGFVNSVFSNNSLFIFLFWFALMIGALTRAVIFFIWKATIKKQIARGQDVRFGTTQNKISFMLCRHSWFQIAAISFYLLFCFLTKQYLSLVYILGMLVPLIIMAYLISRIRPDAVTNQIIQTIVPSVILIVVLTVLAGFLFTDNGGLDDLEDVPLLYEDIGGDAGHLGDIHLDGSTSVLGSGLRCWLYYDEESIYYYVYTSDHQWILDRIWKDEMERKYNQTGTDVSQLWGAEEAIQNVRGDYLVRYPDAVLIMNFAEDTVLSPEQIQTVRTALYESR